MRAMYRNPLWQVKSVLDMRHPEHYKAGKGRTGLMVSAYLVYCGMSAEEALQLYAHRRTTNNEGVSHIRSRYQANVVTWGTGKIVSLSLRKSMMNLLKSTYLRRVAENYEESDVMTHVTLIRSSFVVSELQELTVRDLDKIGKKGRSICGPNFCLELLFGPANAETLTLNST
ncbi:hypothetical protein J5N97_000406 [Dioscorea zingiberensis]|uniref:Uncharacterized protein n=1 Tax=Dioscorea zingiberensis TaxID=325984 RepID=A0A9D5BSE2_9LILI|nr:hypothetical protein J5N97_000406 [Dioscorea zingiberensis]